VQPRILGLALITALGIARPQATAVSGVVFDDANRNGTRDGGEAGIAGVAVSNQDAVVTTDATGAFRLPTAGTGVVFVSTPDGYRTTGPFWRPADATRPLAFALARDAGGGELTFIHASDTHISPASLPRTQRLRALVDSINPGFLLITGDLVRDALRVPEAEAVGYYELFVKERNGFRTPVFTVPGNHEVFGIERDTSHVPITHPLYGRAMYRHYLGPDYYSFTRGGVHFVGLNTVDIDDQRYYGRRARTPEERKLPDGEPPDSGTTKDDNGARGQPLPRRCRTWSCRRSGVGDLRKLAPLGSQRRLEVSALWNSAPFRRARFALVPSWSRSRERRRRQHAIQTHVVRELAVVIRQVERVAEQHVRARHVSRLPAECDRDLVGELRVIELADRPLAILERRLELGDQRVLGPRCLHGVGGRGVLGRPCALHRPEIVAEEIVVVHQMLGDEPDALLRRRRLVAELRLRDRIESLGEVPVGGQDAVAERRRDRVGWRGA